MGTVFLLSYLEQLYLLGPVANPSIFFLAKLQHSLAAHIMSVGGGNLRSVSPSLDFLGFSTAPGTVGNIRAMMVHQE